MKSITVIPDNAKTLKDVREWLARTDVDGLFSTGECACLKSDLFTCEQSAYNIINMCEGGYKGPADDENGWGYTVGPNRTGMTEAFEETLRCLTRDVFTVHARNKNLLTVNVARNKQVKLQRDVLIQLQWSYDREVSTSIGLLNDPACPVCNNFKDEGHTSDCQLDAALKRNLPCLK